MSALFVDHRWEVIWEQFVQDGFFYPYPSLNCPINFAGTFGLVTVPAYQRAVGSLFKSQAFVLNT